jgi:hypothetical protein
LGFLPRKTAANRGKEDAITRLILRTGGQTSALCHPAPGQ